jgi:hypothetical protein
VQAKTKLSYEELLDMQHKHIPRRSAPPKAPKGMNMSVGNLKKNSLISKFDSSHEIREMTDSNLSSTRGRNKGYMQPTSTSVLKDRTLTPQQQ